MIKPKIIEEDPSVTTTQLGLIDTIFLSTYSIGLFISGSLADNYKSTYVLAISLSLVGIIVMLTGFVALEGAQINT